MVQKDNRNGATVEEQGTTKPVSVSISPKNTPPPPPPPKQKKITWVRGRRSGVTPNQIFVNLILQRRPFQRWFPSSSHGFDVFQCHSIHSKQTPVANKYFFLNDRHQRQQIKTIHKQIVQFSTGRRVRRFGIFFQHCPSQTTTTTTIKQQQQP